MIQWWSAVGLVGCYWSTGEDKAAEDALMGLQETGERGGRGGARGRRRQGKRRREGSEEMGIIKKVTLCAAFTKWSGIHFETLVLLMHTHTHTSSAPVRTELHLAFKASQMFRRPRDGKGEGMPIKVLLQLCSCASDDLKVCVTDVLQDSTETELHQVCVCVCVCGGCTFVTHAHSSYNDIHRCW